MNYLALCKRLRQEAGLSGTGPASVLEQTGEMLRVVDWIDGAYEDVQNLHNSWRFLRTDFDFSTIASTSEYTPAAAGLDDHASWIKEDLRLYSSVADEDFLEYCPWDEFRTTYQFGSRRTQEERPKVVTVKPDNSLRFWPIPDAVYTVDGEYYKAAESMSANDDEPNFPARLHMILVWKGLMYYGTWAAAEESYARGEREYNRVKALLEFSELEDWGHGDPLA